jgi:hypothetical protein
MLKKPVESLTALPSALGSSGVPVLKRVTVEDSIGWSPLKTNPVTVFELSEEQDNNRYVPEAISTKDKCRIAR